MVFAVLAVLGGHWLGGGAALGRVDAALLIPTLGFAAVPLYLMTSRTGPRPALAAGLGAIAVVMLSAILAAIQPARPDLAQLLLLLAASAAIGALLGTLGQRVHTRPGLIRVGLLVAAAALWWFGSHVTLAALYRAPSPPDTGRTVMLTGLPLVAWSDPAAARAARAARAEAAALTMLRKRLGGTLVLRDALDAASLRPGDRLLLAHPRPLDAESLAEVDRFVRSGGRAVILADGLSGWPPPYAMGDPRNPPITSLLTPLLDHWGVRLEAPLPGSAGERPVIVQNGRQRLTLHSPGHFSAYPVNCRTEAAMTGGQAVLIACHIGAGRAVLLADADLLFDPLWRPEPLWASHLRPSDNIEWLTARLNGDADAGAWGLRPTWRD